MTQDEDRFFDKLVRLYIAARDLMDGTAVLFKAPWYRLRSAERWRAIGNGQRSGGGTPARERGAVPESGSSTSDTGNVLQP